MKLALRIMAAGLWMCMMAIDSLYGHSIYGKALALALFVLSVGLILGSLGNSESHNP